MRIWVVIMITKDLAKFTLSTNFHKIPENVVNQAKLCFMDFLSVSVRGSQTKSARIMQNLFNKGSKSDESTVIGGNINDPMNASLINGVSAHSLDLDDGHRLAQIHPGACIIPAALSLSEAYGKSGKDFITSIIVGYQVAIRLGIILNPGHRERGFHSTGTCGTLGAAAAAAKIMDLNYDEILNTLGIAGTQAAGLLEADHSGSVSKHLHAGRAAQSGVLSALLAKKGFTGAHTILEGKEGLLKAMGNEDSFLENDPLFNQFEIHQSIKFEILGVYFKKYPVCRHLHTSLDAVNSIMKNNNLKPVDVQDINVETYKIAALHNNYQPSTPEGVRQSLPVSIAILINEGDLTIENIPRIPMENKIAETAYKVRIKEDINLNSLYPQKRPARITIKCSKKLYTERVDLAPGEPEKPYGKEELLKKFRKLNPHVDLSSLKILDDLEDNYLSNVMNKLNKEFTQN